MVDLVALRSLVALERLGTVAATAQELGFTPSAVSQQLKRLERDAGATLLVPVGRGVVLTSAGRVMVAGAPAVFDSIESLLTAARTDAEPQGVFRLASFSTAIRSLVAPMLSTLRERHPALDVHVSELNPEQALTAVQRGECDAAIVHDSSGELLTLPPTLEQDPLMIDHGDVAIPVGHHLADRAVATAHDLACCAWVASPTSTFCHRWLIRLIAQLPGDPELRHEVDDFSSQLALVAAGDVVALLPRLGRPPVPPGVTVLALRPAPRRAVALVYRRAAASSPELLTVRAMLAR